MQTVSSTQLNRWTLQRQMLLERVPLDAVTCIERLAGMQAQYSPSPYIGLWSRLVHFHREELHDALEADRVFKATLMRGTLHLVSARDFDSYRVVTLDPNSIHSRMVLQLHDLGIDTTAVRAEVMRAIGDRPHTRTEIRAAVRHHVPEHLHPWAAWSTVALEGDVINIWEDARFGYFGGSRYRLAPPREVDQDEAWRHVITAYLGAFGPASRADLAQWSGQTVGRFAGALDSLDLIAMRAEDGRTLLDLPDAPRGDADVPVPVRFLPKWDNLLLAYARRERVLPEEYRKIVIRKNGDVLPTFLVNGRVAGTWDAPLRGRAVLSLTPLEPLDQPIRTEVEAEGERLLAWLRPDVEKRELRWTIASEDG